MEALVNEPNSVSKQMLPAHVREMHRNRDKGFEAEFGVRTFICQLQSMQSLYIHSVYTTDLQTEVHVINQFTYHYVASLN